MCFSSVRVNCVPIANWQTYPVLGMSRGQIDNKASQMNNNRYATAQIASYMNCTILEKQFFLAEIQSNGNDPITQRGLKLSSILCGIYVYTIILCNTPLLFLMFNVGVEKPIRCSSCVELVSSLYEHSYHCVENFEIGK